MKTARAPIYTVEALRRSVQSLTIELLAVYEELALLYSVSSQIGRLADEHQIAAIALKEAIEISSAHCGWVALWDGHKLRVPEACRTGIDCETAERINRAILEPLLRAEGHNFISHALRQESQLNGDDIPDRFLATALTIEGRPRGYLCLGRAEAGNAFLSPDQKLISAVGLLLAVELENVRLQRSELDKQRIVNELELAHTIQQSLLPRDFSVVTFLEAAGISEPCGEIGGDFFDLIPLDNDRCTLIIADVSGKGPPAALQAAMVQGIVNAAIRTCPDLPFLMSTLNECLLMRVTADRFVTAFACTLNRDGRLLYSNGGHNSPLWIPRTGEVTELSEGGPLLGVFPQSKYAQPCVQMSAGDLLLMYTDGVTEAHDLNGNLFGTTRLLEWAQHQRGREAGEVKDSLIATVHNFCGGCLQHDDRSVLVLRYAGTSGSD